MSTAIHDSPPPRSASRIPATRRRHWEVLVLSTLVILASAILDNRADGRVAPIGLSRWPLPPLCWSKELLGVSCPGCGLTRSFVHIAHGRFATAFLTHRLGPLLFAIVLLQIPYRAAALRHTSPRHSPLWTTLPHFTSLALIVLLIANWLLGILLALPHAD